MNVVLYRLCFLFGAESSGSLFGESLPVEARPPPPPWSDTSGSHSASGLLPAESVTVKRKLNESVIFVNITRQTFNFIILLFVRT